MFKLWWERLSKKKDLRSGNVGEWQIALGHWKKEGGGNGLRYEEGHVRYYNRKSDNVNKFVDKEMRYWEVFHLMASVLSKTREEDFSREWWGRGGVLGSEESGKKDQ